MQGGQGGGSGSGSGSGAGGGVPGSSAGCTSYTQTSDPTQVGVNPCVYYVPSAVSQITGNTSGSSADSLLNALNGGSGSASNTSGTGTANSGGSSTAASANTNASPQGVLQQVVNGTNVGGLNANSQNASFNSSGVLGNIIFTNGGGTILASTINPGNNSAVSSFYGADVSTQPKNAVSGMCQNRPWSSNFLSNIIPPSFFDSLCQWGGFKVGIPAPVQTQVTLQQTVVAPKKSPVATTTVATTTSAVPARVQIWAVPSSVRLGARTSIFWNTQGVTNCTETSPDGSFTQSTLSGAQATVPITAATTFTISCLDSGGHPVSDYVTVHIAI